MESRPEIELRVRVASMPASLGRLKDKVDSLYAGIRLGRQELDCELLTDTPGALWTSGAMPAASGAARPGNPNPTSLSLS